MRWALVGAGSWLLLLYVFALWWRKAHRHRPPSPAEPLYLPEGWVERYRRRELR